MARISQELLFRKQETNTQMIIRTEQNRTEQSKTGKICIELKYLDWFGFK